MKTVWADPAVWLLLSGGLCVLIAGMVFGLALAAWHSRRDEQRDSVDRWREREARRR